MKILNKTIIASALSLAFLNVAFAEETAPNQPLSAQETFESLSPAAIAKIREANIDINALLTNESNDIIVTFDESNFPVIDDDNNGKSVAVQKYKAVKSYVDGLLSGKTVKLRDYYGSPTSFYRVGSKDDLVKLLNSDAVVSVMPNAVLEKTLAESLPFIRQPGTIASYYTYPDGKKSYFTGGGSVIAVMDTGLDATHSDFGNCRYSTTDCSVLAALEFADDSNGRPDGKLEDDPSRHGTNVSAISHGVAPDAKLVSLDVFSSSYNSSTGRYELGAPNYAILAALNWVYNNHISRNSEGLNINSINMSLGGGYERYSTNTVPMFGTLKDMGVASVVASGNEYYTDAIAWPASERNTISVGAVHDTTNNNTWIDCGRFGFKQGFTADQETCFSNSSNLLDLLAPGYNITGGGVTLSGTSMAAPHVAGAYAILRSPTYLDITGDDVDATTRRFKNNGVAVRDTRNSIVKPRLDLYSALWSAAN